MSALAVVRVIDPDPLEEFEVRVWIEAHRLDDLIVHGITAGLPEHEARMTWGRLNLTIRVPAQRGVDAPLIAYALVRDAIDAACPSLIVTAMGAGCTIAPNTDERRKP